MPIQHIDLDEYEATIAELVDRDAHCECAAVVITDQREVYGRTTLRREAGILTIEAEKLFFARDAFA